MAKWDIPKKRPNNGRVALIDGDVIVYRIGFSVQKDVYTLEYEGNLHRFEGKRALNTFLYEEKLPPDSEDVIINMHTEVEPVQNAYHSINILLDQILEATDAEDYEIYISGPTNFRTEIARTAPYKGNRTGRKPEYYDDIRNWLVQYKGAQISDGIEADDVLSICQYNRDNTVIVSIDKDLDMVPGDHYNWVSNTLYTISPLEGARNFWTQMITGDTVDNIKGIPGLGKVKASKHLAGCKDFYEMFQVVLKLYTEHFKEEAQSRFVENSILLWMLRHESEKKIKNEQVQVEVGGDCSEETAPSEV